MVKILNDVRKQYKIWENRQIQNYSCDNFYAFSRGDVFVALTNTWDNVNVTIDYEFFADDTKLCNVLKQGDCILVQEGKFNVSMNGEPKIYVTSS